MDKLKRTFVEISQKYTNDNNSIEMLWQEIEKNYCQKNRYYHSLVHLENLFNQLTEIKDEIDDWDTIILSLFYHDIIYKAIKSDNEEKSADLAKKRLQFICFPNEKINKCVLQILATKSHSVSDNNDLNLFIDADLSILGQNWEMYSSYFNQVRKEYSIYPDFIYNSGRKKVLNHFLNMEKIFKTTHFFDKFENRARLNLEQELNLL